MKDQYGIPYDKIGTPKAKAEFAAQRAAVHADEKKFIGSAEIERIRMAQGGADFCLFNYIASIISFEKVCKEGSVRKGMHFIYNAMWPFLKQVVEDNRRLKSELIKQMAHLDTEESPWTAYLSPGMKEVVEREDPLTFSKTALDAVREAARTRARMKGKGVYTDPDKKLVVE